MSHPYAPGPTVHLALEQLESCEVPATFGATRGLSIAFGDVLQTNNQPGPGQFITGTGPGTVATVNIYGLNGFAQLVPPLRPFGQFTGGVYVAAADVFGLPNANLPELIVSTGPGITGRVKVYTFEFGAMKLRANFTPFGDNYTGGVQLATGLVAGDLAVAQPKRNIVVGMQTGGSTVKVYSISGGSAVQVRQFDAFEPGYKGGVTVAAGNVDNQSKNLPNTQRSTNYSEIIVGRGANFPEVRTFRADEADVDLIGSYFAFDLTNPANRVGVDVFAANTDGIRGVEVYVVRKNNLNVRVFYGETATFRGSFQGHFPSSARSVNMTADLTLESPDGSGTSGPNSLFVVAADGPYNQIPIVFAAKSNSPAGFNGSKFA